MDDLISRKAVVELLDNIDSIYLKDYDDTFKSYTDLVNALFDEDRLPSAQPELPEWAQKVEEYRKSAPSFVRNQLVWALYQTWKDYDGRLVHQRGKENR